MSERENKILLNVRVGPVECMGYEGTFDNAMVESYLTYAAVASKVRGTRA
jgi:hypothetical protein